TQGPIARPDLERLGKGDEGIILFRNMLKRQLEIVRDGGEPIINVFRDPIENQGLESPAIPNEFHHWPNLAGRSGDNQPRNTARVRNQDGSPREEDYIYVPVEAGYSTDAEKIVAAIKTWDG